MLRGVIQRIRQKVHDEALSISTHAQDEMADDDLDVFDVENAILTGHIERVEKDDPRGTRYVVIGTALDGERQLATVGRFIEDGRYRIITVYELD